MSAFDLRIGGPCTLCGLPQVARRSECPGKPGCAYAPPTEDSLVITPSRPMRLGRMLALCIATQDRLSQKRLSDETGVSETTISRFLSGQRLPDARSFAALLSWCLEEQKDPSNG